MDIFTENTSHIASLTYSYNHDLKAAIETTKQQAKISSSDSALRCSVSMN